MRFPSSNFRPSIAIIPLGTGNDLSRSLNWGGKYRDKPLRKVLIDIAKADILHMDRWKLDVEVGPETSRKVSLESQESDFSFSGGSSKTAEAKLVS